MPRCLVTRSDVETPCGKGLSWRPHGHKTIFFGEHEKAYLQYVSNVYVYYIYTHLRNYMNLDLDKFISSKLRYSIQVMLYRKYSEMLI